MRHTKIVATLGPASDPPGVLERLVAAGVDVFRLNFSHGTPAGHQAAVARVRECAAQAGRIVAVMQDLSGPKIRTGRLAGGGPMPLETGGRLVIEGGDFEGGDGRVATAFLDLAGAVGPGDRLLLDDGRLQLEVEEAGGGRIVARVTHGGPLGEHKGITVPNVTMPTGAVTEKDVGDIALGREIGVDMVAVSFVQTPADLRRAREVLGSAGSVVPIIAKIERPQAVDRLDQILEVSDAVMVARGDLGLEVPLEQVPRIQKQITRRARHAGIPVIVATQVLDSMIRLPRPTRAEVSDAANAVADGVDAIMLTGETAAGSFPVSAVETLDLIIRDAEADLQASGSGSLPPPSEFWHGSSLCDAAVSLAANGHADAIVAVTRRGKTARMLARLRPRVPIFAVTDDALLARGLSLRWGIVPLEARLSSDIAATEREVERLLLSRGDLTRGQVVIVVNVSADISADGANFLRLRRLV